MAHEFRYVMKWALLTLLVIVTFAVPAPATTPAQYAALIRTVCDRASSRQLRAVPACQAKSTAISRYTVFYAMGEAFLARRTGESARAERAWQVVQAVNQCMLQGRAKDQADQCRQMEAALGELIQIVGWLDELGRLSAEQRRQTHTTVTSCADGLLRVAAERGAMNRAAMAGSGAATAWRQFPQAEGATRWKQFAEATWNDWWGFRDTFEDSSHYNGLWLAAVLAQGESLGKEVELADPAVERLLDRWLRQVTPLGPLADYGDAIWPGCWAHWAAAFEWGGRQFRRSDFRGAADALVRYMQQKTDWLESPDPEVIAGLVRAAGWADSTVAVGQLRLPSCVTQRHDSHGRTLFDKLVLRTSGPEVAYVLANLHDVGYHGHADGGAMSALVLNGTLVLYELGYHARQETLHHSFLIRPADEPFLYYQGEIQPQRWYTTELDLRRPWTYIGGPVPDLHSINQLVFRLQMAPGASERFTFDIGPLDAVTADGRTVTIIDPARAGEAACWVPGVRGVNGALQGTMNTARVTKGGVSWLSRSFQRPLDLSGYARLRVRWLSGTAAFDPETGAQLGLADGQGASQRWNLQQQRTYRETTTAEVRCLPGIETGKFVETMVDPLGRPLRHTRRLVLATQPVPVLCVWDHIEFQSPGQYAIGPLWHVADIVRSNDRGFVCRNEGTWDLPRAGTPDGNANGTTFWIGLAGPAGTVLAHERHALTDFHRPVAQKEHLFARWTGAARKPLSFLSVVMPINEQRRPESVALVVEDAESRLRLPGREYVFSNDGECQVRTAR
jgi:hypothetical protein